VDDVGEAAALADPGDGTLLEATDLSIESRGFDLKGYKATIPTAEDIGHPSVSWDQAHVAIATN
jgi:hypothetical protein